MVDQTTKFGKPRYNAVNYVAVGLATAHTGLVKPTKLLINAHDNVFYLELVH